MDNNVDRRLLLESLCLWQSSRKSVQEPVLVAKSLQLGRDEADHDLVGNKITAIDEALGFLAKIGALLDVASQEIAGGDVLELEVPDDPVGDGAFAGAGCSHDEGVDSRSCAAVKASRCKHQTRN